MYAKQGIMDANGEIQSTQGDNVSVVEPNGPRAREAPPPYTEQPPRTVIRETIIIQPPLKDGPTLFPCPSCLKRVLTKVEYINTRKTHMIAGFICGFTCWCLLCCLAAIPYVIPTFKNVEHYCPDCNLFLGEYSKI